MSASIARLHRRSFEFDQVLVALRAGDHSAVLERTRADARPEHAVLRARALMRTRAVAEALETIDAIDMHALPPAMRVEASLLRASAAARSGDPATASEAIVEARVHAYSSSHPSVEMDVLVHVAALAFMDGDLDAVRRAVDEALAIVDDRSLLAMDRVPLWDGHHVTARALEIKAFVAGSQSNFDVEYECLRAAFEAVRRSRTSDLWLEAKIASTLSMHAGELGSADALGGLREWATDVVWTADLRLERYHVERALGLAAALGGDRREALRRARTAFAHAPSASWRLLVMLDRVQLARDEATTSVLLLDEIDALREAADRIDWSASPGEGYAVLLGIAQTLAHYDVERAQHYLDVYADVHRRSARDLVGRYDPRRAAHHAFAVGTIAAVRGNTAAALDAFDRAHATFTGASCVWRAALVAIERYSVDRSPRSRDVADAASASFRDSWFTRRYRELREATA